MTRQMLMRLCGAAGLAMLALGVAVAAAQVGQPQGTPPQPDSPSGAASTKDTALPVGGAAALMRTPVTTLFPGDVPMKSGLKSPVGDSPEAAQRGMRFFTAFNCIGCHASNGGGGMGPALSNSAFIYGSEPENIFLTIYQGRPRGMPAWGSMLPDTAIWDLVAYVRSISKEPAQGWGRTFSRDAMKIEQVPSEFASTATPWDRTEAFSGGQSPNTAK